MSGDDPELAQIMREFRAGLSERVAHMREAARAAQRGGPDAAEHQETLRVLAHRLRGTAGSFGLPELGEPARVIETQCKGAADWTTLLSAIDAIEKIIQKSGLP